MHKARALGRAIDLVEAVDQVMGEESGAGGDLQFRLYVYLKPNAVDILGRSQEFFHDKDNSGLSQGLSHLLQAEERTSLDSVLNFARP